MEGFRIYQEDRLAAGADDANRYVAKAPCLMDLCIIFALYSTEMRRRFVTSVCLSIVSILNAIQERPICQQCASVNRHHECQWDQIRLSGTENLEARVRELEEVIELKWRYGFGRLDSSVGITNGKHLVDKNHSTI